MGLASNGASFCLNSHTVMHTLLFGNLSPLGGLKLSTPLEGFKFGFVAEGGGGRGGSGIQLFG